MRITALALLLLASPFGARAAVNAPPLSAAPLPLRSGVTIHDAIGGSGETKFTLDVPAQTAIRVHVIHKGVYTIVDLRRGSERIDHSDDSNGVDGDESIVTPIVPSAATYEVGVSAVVHDVCGSYDLTVETLPLDDTTRALSEGHRLQNEARLLEQAGDGKSLELSQQKFDEAIALLQAAGDPLGEAEALYRAAIVKGQVSRTAQGIAFLDRVIPLFHDLDLQGAEGRSIDRLGEFRRRIGDVAEAERLLISALPLANAANDAEGECDVRNNLGLLYEQSGRWEEAMALFQAALPLSERASIDVRSAIFHNLAQVYADMGDYRRSLATYQQSLTLKRRMSLPRRTAQTLQALSGVYLALGDVAKAQSTVEESQRLWEVSGDPQGIGGTAAVMGRIHLEHGDRDAAAASFTKAAEMFRRTKDRRGEGRLKTKLAEIALARGDATHALELLPDALAMARDSADRVGEAGALYQSARALQAQGRIDEAIDRAEEAVSVVEAMREAIVSPELRSTYLDTVRRYFDLVIELQMSKEEHAPGAGFAAKAFQTNERSRARTLLESLAQSETDVHKGIAPELLAREQRIARELIAKESYHTQLLRAERHGPELGEVERVIASLGAESRETRAEILRTSPEYAALEFPEPLSLTEVQSRLLAPDTILLEYHLGAERSWLWIVSQHEVVVRHLPGERRIDELARTWHDLLRRNPSALEPAAAKALRTRVATAGEALARAVFRPAEEAAKGKRLLIVPDGALHYVPFGAFPDRAGRPLIATHEVTYLPSATVLDTLRRLPRVERSANAAAVFADPVFQRNDSRFGGAPSHVAETRSTERWASNGTFERLRFSRKEAQSILAAADPATSLEALDFAASKQVFATSDLRKFSIIHIATHGIVNSEEPDLSGLVFSLYDAHRKKVDGFLRLRDIYNLDLRADLVVLSACRTALGKAMYGEGLISLTRGFMYGGSRRVMATVWSVDDRATAQLMNHFYESMLRRGASPSQALRSAQLAMRNDPRWSDAYYWAAFTLQGEWR